MKITVQSHDDSDDDCKRDTYFTIVDGVNHLLAPCALGSWYTHLEIVERAKTLFGDDVEIEYDCWIQNEKPDYIS
jgi:hypothetical protein